MQEGTSLLGLAWPDSKIRFNALLKLFIINSKRMVNSKQWGVYMQSVSYSWMYWKDSELNMVPFQSFCLEYTLPPPNAKCLVLHVKCIGTPQKEH